MKMVTKTSTFPDFWHLRAWRKLLAEGSDIEADLVTMSTFYVESAQDEKKMFKDLKF